MKAPPGEARGATPLIAVGKGEAQTETSLAEQLTPGDSLGEYSCPAGKPLPVASRRKDGSTELLVPEGICEECPLREECRLYPKRGKRVKVRAEEARKILARHHARMREAASRAAYSRRKVICEPVFGSVKNKEIRIFVRGESKVATWWKLTAAAHNVEKIVRHMQAAKKEAA